MKQVFRFDNNGCYLEPVVIQEGQDVPSDCTDQPLPQPNWKPVFKDGKWIETVTPDELLAPKKAQKAAELNSAYAAELTGGFETLATGNPIKFKYAEIDQLNFTKRTNAIALGTSDQKFLFGTANGVIEFTADQWRIVSKDAERHEMAVYQKLMEKRKTLADATLPSEVDELTW